MEFIDLKAGGVLYIYDREAVKMTSEEIAGASPQREEEGVRVVDVTAGGVTYTLRADGSRAYAGGLALCADAGAALLEVGEQRRELEETLAGLREIEERLVQ